jgi:glycoprotein endo-alpha-1,2-mannosidase
VRQARWLPAAVTALLIGACSAVPAVASPAMPTQPGMGEVSIFYYPWYGTAARDGAWEHWQQNGNAPPSGIASSWYPLRGAYSSSDPTVVRAQMREIAAAGIQKVIVSWWGPGSVEEARLPLVLREARAARLRVAIHVEPFGGRSPAMLAPLLRDLSSRGITDFYVYDSTASADEEWRALNASLRGLRLFANTNLPGKAKAGGFAGLYTYDVRVFDGSSFRRMCDGARLLGLLCAPSVGPGFDSSRATGNPEQQARDNGATYDIMWRRAIHASPDIVTITSYNEWHEGTQIEPAAPRPDYASYNGAWGSTGRIAEFAYLTRTAYWVDAFRASCSDEAARQYKAAASLRR